METPLQMVFLQDYKHINPRATKLGTHMQVHNPNTPAKFQGHPPIITPFTPHMCDFQGRYANIVNIALYPYDHI